MILDDILEKLKNKSYDKAYTIHEKSYTYKTFYQYICNIYKFLKSEKKDKTPVIVYGHKDVYMKATFLACSFAGITYIPIDKSMPKERIALILEQIKPNIIIGNLESGTSKVISEKQIYEIMEKEDYEEINEIYLKPEDIYYIIFTSGSTGIPKGVKVTYRNLNSCVKWLEEIVGKQKGVILNQANFSFDLSVADLYLSTITASEHFILEDNARMDFALMFKELKHSKATIAVMTPSFADLLLLDKSFNEELMPNLRTIIFCGEKLLNSTVQKLYSRFSNIRVINSYGPTECTFAVTSIEITKELMNEENLPIGKPKKDVEIVIVDENRNKLSDEEIGEILIIGESVADGYIGNASNNAFISYNGKKAYLTGDLGYYKDGNLYYKCRKDKQVKYKGYRIEIADIENNFYELNYIEKVVVVAKKSQENKVVKLIAFIKLKEKIEKSELEIKNDLALKVPEYMCPTIKIIDEFPLNKNGKCDERRLLMEGM